MAARNLLVRGNMTHALIRLLPTVPPFVLAGCFLLHGRSPAEDAYDAGSVDAPATPVPPETATPSTDSSALAPEAPPPSVGLCRARARGLEIEVRAIAPGIECIGEITGCVSLDSAESAPEVDGIRLRIGKRCRTDPPYDCEITLGGVGTDVLGRLPSPGSPVSGHLDAGTVSIVFGNGEDWGGIPPPALLYATTADPGYAPYAPPAVLTEWGPETCRTHDESGCAWVRRQVQFTEAAGVLGIVPETIALDEGESGSLTRPNAWIRLLRSSGDICGGTGPIAGPFPASWIIASGGDASCGDSGC